MKKLLLISVGVILLAVGAGVAAWQMKPNVEVGSLPDIGREGGSAPTPHPLSRDAIAAREYPGSPIRVERDLGDKGGFRSYLVSYQSEGLKIYSLMNVPTGLRPAAGWPVIIFNHGYIPPAEYRTLGGDYAYWLNGLSRQGYIVLKPDYRGHDQSQGQAGGGNFSPEYTYDTLNLVNSIKAYPEADGSRIGMAGHSMGASVMLRTITVSPDVKASVSLAGVVGSASDLVYNWRRTVPRPMGSIPPTRQRMIDQYGEPKSNPDFWNSISPTSYVQLIAGPVQIHHGTADGEVPVEFSGVLNGALAQAGKPVQYFQYPGADHQFSGQGDVVLQRMLAHFNAHLKQR